MPTVSDVAKRLDQSPSTIRAWSDEFADFLSAEATPGKGKTRVYNEDDMGVFSLVASMRQDGKPYEAIQKAIQEALDSGEGLSRPQEEAGGPTTGTGLTLYQMTALLSEQRGRMQTLEEERDFLREENRKLTERAVRAETLLEASREGERLESPGTPTGAAVQAQSEGRRPWWKFWGR